MKLIWITVCTFILTNTMGDNTFAELCGMAPVAYDGDDKSIYMNRVGRREKATYSTSNRCNTFVCVLESPKNEINIAAVMRNIDTLGVKMLCIIDTFNVLPQDWKNMRNSRHLVKVSASAIKWAYVKKFVSTSECIEYLKSNNFTSAVTSPHPTSFENVKNVFLDEGVFTEKKLAVWFGNETKGISDEAIKASTKCIQMKTFGMAESLNLAVSTGIVMYEITKQRRQFEKLKKNGIC